MQGKARILLYGLSPEERRRVAEGLAAIGIPPALRAGPAQLGTSVRGILGGEEAAAGEALLSDRAAEAGDAGEVPRERLVLFHNLSDAGVQRLMGFFRQALAGRPIFAVTTPTSLQWSLGGLLAHLLEERAALERRE
jgi:hypothetical protein